MSDVLVWTAWTEYNENECESWSVFLPMTEVEFSQISDLVEKCASISEYFEESFTFSKLDFVPDKRSVELCNSLSDVGYYSAFQMFDYDDSLVNRLINALNEFFDSNSSASDDDREDEDFDDEEEVCDFWLYKLRWLN